MYGIIASHSGLYQSKPLHTVPIIIIIIIKQHGPLNRSTTFTHKPQHFDRSINRSLGPAFQPPPSSPLPLDDDDR